MTICARGTGRVTIRSAALSHQLGWTEGHNLAIKFRWAPTARPALSSRASSSGMALASDDLALSAKSSCQLPDWLNL
jgi:hypothetical protein